ncbi:ABC transporter permease [Loktanella sp. DJP18]|uniref:ABC transporter permease n=1 Tax=Loktanella sp. DJP18 TaxID=3409788 RepID=UPI003BB7C61E
MSLTNFPRKSGKSRRGLVVRTGRTTIALMLREMGSTYGRTPGGYVWAILEPIGMIVLLAAAFSLVVRAPSLGTSFIVFYATGYLPYQFFSTTAVKTGRALQYSRSLLSYPSVLWIDAFLARFMLNFLTSTMVFCIVMTGIVIFVDARVSLDIFPVIIGLSLAACLGLGIGMVNCLLGGLFPIWLSIWSIVSRPLFLASGVLFILEDMPRSIQDILWWNPLVHATGLVRSGFYSTYEPNYISLPYVWGLTLVLIVLGLVFMKPNYQRVLEM